MYRWLLYPVLTSTVEALEYGIRQADIRRCLRAHHPQKEGLNPGNVTQALLSVLQSRGIRVTGGIATSRAPLPAGARVLDLCAARGLSGTQGVLIPAANAQHLMLRADVVDACAEGRFSVSTVASVDDAIEALTGLAAGERDADGRFPADSINGRVEARLLAFAQARREFGAPPGEKVSATPVASGTPGQRLQSAGDVDIDADR